MIYIGKNEYKYGRMLMSHMASKDIDELHRMAHSLGLKRKWFQDIPSHPHYDISKGFKKLAIQLGAIEVEDKELIYLCYPKMREWPTDPTLDYFGDSQLGF